jgi:putative ABC transport system permease protein
VLLAFADQRRTAFIIFGTLAAAVGLLLLSSLAIRMLATAGRHAPISVRLALRDLSRYQARSGAALGAVTLATGIAATITIGAAAAQNPSGPGNLPANQMMLYFTPGGIGDPVPPLRPGQLHTLTTTVNQVAASIGASLVLPVEQAYDPQSALLSPPPGGDTGAAQQNGYPTASLAHLTKTARGGNDVTTMFPLYVATPALLSRYGITENEINPHTDVLSSRSDLTGLQIFAPVFGSARAGACKICAAPQGPDKSPRIARPAIQMVNQLPPYGSDPATLITPRAMQTLGLRSLPSGWLVQTDHPLSTTDISTARQAAASAGLYIETRHAQKSLAPLRNWSTAAGIMLALGVLAMTVGLIRSETANDLRTLAASGASSHTRRNLTAATAGALALLGGVLGTAGASGALLVCYRNDLHRLSHVPVANLVVILAGLPLIAVAAGWLLAGREPPALSRTPLE